MDVITGDAAGSVASGSEATLPRPVGGRARIRRICLLGLLAAVAAVQHRSQQNGAERFDGEQDADGGAIRMNLASAVTPALAAAPGDGIWPQ